MLQAEDFDVQGERKILDLRRIMFSVFGEVAREGNTCLFYLVSSKMFEGLRWLGCVVD